MIQSDLTIKLIKIMAVLLLISLAVGGMILTVRWRKKQKQKKKQYEQQVRTQILSQSIKNSMRGTPVKPLNGLNESNSGEQRRLLRLVLGWNGTEKEYILNPEEHILVGTAPGSHICLEGISSNGHQCEFFTYDHFIYVRDLGPLQDVKLLRKGKGVLVDHVGIRICTGDKLLIGQYYIRIEQLDPSGRTMQDER